MFGQITLLFQYSLIIGLVLAFPYIIFELWRFVAPALGEKQQKKLRSLFSPARFSFCRRGVLLLHYHSVLRQLCSQLYYQQQNQKQLYHR